MANLRYSGGPVYVVIFLGKGYGNCSRRSCKKMASIFCEGCDEVWGVFVAVAISGHPTTFKLSSNKLNQKTTLIDFIFAE